jgi:hypothetical protein
MKSLLAVAMFALALLRSETVSAQPRGVAFEVSGCEVWAAFATDTIERKDELNWFRGFVSGHDFTVNPKRSSVRVVSDATIVGSVDTFCRDHPNLNMLHAALNLVSLLPPD